MDEAKPDDDVLAPDRGHGAPADAAPGRRRPQAHLGRGQHRLHRRAGRRRGQALPQLRRLLRVHGVRARLRPGRPAARRARPRVRRRGRRRRHGHRLRPLRPRRQGRVRLRPLPQRPLGARVRAHALRLAARRSARSSAAPTASTPRRSPSSSASARATRSTSTARASAACSPTSRRCSPSTTCPTCAPDVFLMDMRAQGKGFDAFYQRAQDMGVNFIRSRPSYIKEDPLTNDLLITWEDEAGTLHDRPLRHGRALGRPRARAQGAGGGRRTSASPSTATASASCTSTRRSTRAARASSWWARSASPRTSPTRSPRPRPRRPR